MAGLNIVTLNTRGMNCHSKRNKVFTWLKGMNCNIALLQETYCTQKFIKTFDRGWAGTCWHSTTDSTHSRGTCIMISNKVEFNLISKHSSDDGRIILVNIDINDIIYCIVSVYAPNNLKDRKQFISKIEKWVSQFNLNKNNIIIGGDFNCCLLSYDRSPQLT